MTLLRKPVLFLLALATMASLQISGRVSLRLIVDTSIALAPVVVYPLLPLAVVFWTGPRRGRFSDAADRAFDGRGGWFIALALIGAIAAFTGPVWSGAWHRPWILIPLAGALLWSIRADLRFFEAWLGRPRPRAIADVVLLRAMTWPVVVLYFYFQSIPEFLPPR